MEINELGTQAIPALGIGIALFLIVPILIALIWTIRKKERFTTILVGAGAFILFAVLLEKIIQNLLLFPTAMGLPETSLSAFMNLHPILLSFLAGLFPGVFEETGRLIAFKTILKKRTNRETSISYGIGHGGIEVMFVLGVTYITYLMYAVMIKTGTIQSVISQVSALAPDQLDVMKEQLDAIAAISFIDLGVAVWERIFAVLSHIGASILVFYAARDKGRFWLYPLAILLHTLMDFVAALSIFGVIRISAFALEAFVTLTGCLIFFGGYLLLYRKDDTN